MYKRPRFKTLFASRHVKGPESCKTVLLPFCWISLWEIELETSLFILGLFGNTLTTNSKYLFKRIEFTTIISNAII